MGGGCEGGFALRTTGGGGPEGVGMADWPTDWTALQNGDRRAWHWHGG